MTTAALILGLIAMCAARREGVIPGHDSLGRFRGDC